MKKYLFIFSMIACLTFSCKVEDEKLDPMLTDKVWRAMFIREQCRGDVEKNDLIVEWYGINDAAGYVLEIRYGNQGWDKAVHSVTVPANVNRYVFEDMQYGVEFICRIKVLSKLGPEYDSGWYGDGPGGDNTLYLTVRTRYAVPKLILVSDITETSLVINLRLSAQVPFLGADDVMCNEIPEQYTVVNDQFVADEFAVTPRSGDYPTISRAITQAEKDQGFIIVTGLQPNIMYGVDVFNTSTPNMRKWDRYYNTVNVRMKGGEPVIIQVPYIINEADPGAKQLGLSRLDTILLNYYKDSELPEGTIFELEPGGRYYIGNWYQPGGVGTTPWGVMPIEKGFTLRTKENPDGTIAGNGQKARFISTYGAGPGGNNGAWDDGPRRGYWQYGRDAHSGELGQLMMGEIVFKNISNEAEGVRRTYYTGTTKMGHNLNMYWACNEGTPMSVRIEKWEMDGCDFIGYTQGIFKTKNQTGKVIDNFIVKNCTFFAGGYDNNNGAGNMFFRDDGSDWGTTRFSTSNQYKNFVFTNNTIWDIPLGSLVDHPACGWGSDDIAWNIEITNNTFINFAPLSSGDDGAFVNLRNPPPGGGLLTIKNNLFAITEKRRAWAENIKGSTSTTFPTGMYITENSDGRLRYDISNNYCTSEHVWNPTTTPVGVFRRNPFSSFAGAGADPIPGDNPISTLDLFSNPDPDVFYLPNDNWWPAGYTWDWKNAFGDWVNGYRPWPNIYTHLKYKNTSTVTNSDIYKNNIGDPRWR